MKIKICKNCTFEGGKEYFPAFTGRYCLPCHNKNKLAKYHANKQPKIKQYVPKICYKCNFTGDKILFHGRQCKKCANRSRSERLNIKLGKPAPLIIGSQIRICRKCNIEDHKNNFHGHTCKKCFRKNIWSHPVLKLRSDCSRTIRLYMKKFGDSKNGNSILKFLPYSMLELKEHIEKQFESWMTWNNQGLYKKNIWKNNDQTTWVWQIDHIIPQSELPYTSMKDKNFQLCWSLKNLRPLSAKTNLIKSNKLGIL